MYEEHPYRLWEYNLEKYILGLRCFFVPKCRYCNAKPEYWDSTPQKFAINDGVGKKKSHAIDVVLRCPECGYVMVFGVAVPKEHYEEVRKRLGTEIEGSFCDKEIYQTKKTKHQANPS